MKGVFVMNHLSQLSLIDGEDPNYQRLYEMYIQNKAHKDYFIGLSSKGIVCSPGCQNHLEDESKVIFSQRLIDLISFGYQECETCCPLSKGAEKQVVKEFLGKIEQGITPDKFLKQISPDEDVSYSSASKWFQKYHHADLQKYLYIKRINSLLKEENNFVTENETVITYQRFWTPIGVMIGCFIGMELCLLEFADRRILETELRNLKTKLKAVFRLDSSGLSDQLNKELKEYFSGTRKEFSIPLARIGTEFQLKAWDLLRNIPYGQISTYKNQAKLMGKSKAIRAVGRANGMNRIALLIPCHRVIGENGELTGYGGGLDRKKFLLDLEAYNNGGELSKME
jgi:AraC family transcriptional regulator of adaptative response/methylated-DNA-[protein]-cysteine methyltransferase